MRQQFKVIAFKAGSLALIEECNSIIGTYQEQGLRLTLRQLYYQLVTQNRIRNEEKQYKRLSSLVSDGRLAGHIDWDAIEDRVRQPKRCSEWPDIAALVESALSAYRLPRWEGQEAYVELWVEKDALAGVLQPIASRYHVTMMVNRGYSSQSAMYEAADRFIRACYDGITISDMEDDGSGEISLPGRIQRDSVILYLGDMDPSGEDMVRDIHDRLVLFGLRDIEVRKIALTMEQIREYEPPPNPAKRTDPRAAGYMSEHGVESWEVDALPPNVLAQIIEAAISELVDLEKMSAVKRREQIDKERLRTAAKEIMRKAEDG